jgi:hypothetical protein
MRSLFLNALSKTSELSIMFELFPSRKYSQMEAQAPAVEQIEVVEEWRVIAGYDNYSVSNLGRVRNDTTQRILRPSVGSSRYYQVVLCNQGAKSTKYVHKLVATAFLGDSEGRECNHRDINRLNNNLSNLEYCSRSENQQNRSSYRGRVSEYVNELSPDAEPYTHHNGFTLKSGYWRDGNDYYRKVSNGYRKIAAVPRGRKIHIQMKFEDDRVCHIYLDA